MTKTELIGISIMFSNEATCLSVDYCLTVLALWKFINAYWSSTQLSSLRNDVVEKVFNYSKYHSLKEHAFTIM